MTTIPKRIPIRYFSALVDILARQGVDTARLLQIAKLDRERFVRSDSMLLPQEVEALIVAAYQVTGRTDLAFEAGSAIKLNSHDLLGYAMLSCRDLDQVIRLTCRYYHFINELFTMKYTRRPGHGEIIFSPVVAMPLRTMRFLIEQIAVSVQIQIQLLLGPGHVYDIHLGMPAPPHVALYGPLAPARFHFDEGALPGITVRCDTAMLDWRLPMASPKVVEQVEERMVSLQQRPAQKEGWGDYVTMLLRETQGQQVTLEEIAQRMSVSARTVDRNLRKEHLTFRELSQQVRLERAQKMLLQRGATVARVAEQLGFSDAANFARAFRRHVGVTPGAFQQSAAPGEES